MTIVRREKTESDYSVIPKRKSRTRTFSERNYISMERPLAMGLGELQPGKEVAQRDSVVVLYPPNLFDDKEHT